MELRLSEGQIKALLNENATLTQQLDQARSYMSKLIEILKVYGDEKNWKRIDEESPTLIEADKGQLARQILAEFEVKFD